MEEEVESGQDACVEAEEDEDEVHYFVGGCVLLHIGLTLAKTQPLT